MTNVNLGKITHASFGYGGYQDCCIGLNLTFAGEAWGVSDFIGGWDWNRMERSERSQWTEAERDAANLKAMRKLSNVLTAAKKQHVGELVGTPVEVTFDVNRLCSWRVLHEVV